MSDFSECLTVIKDKRGLSSIDVARVCDVDATVIFRWIKGERLPNSFQKIQELERKLRLNEQEKEELEYAYVSTLCGKEKYKSFGEVIHTIGNLKDRIVNEAYKRFAINIKKDVNSETEKIFENDIKFGFLKLNSRNDILRVFDICLSQMNNSKENKIFLKTNTMSVDRQNAISIFPFTDEKCRIEQIIYPAEDNVYGESNESVGLLGRTISTLFQTKNIKIWIGERKNSDNMNYIMSENFVLQYNNDITKGMVTSYPEIVEMYLEIFRHNKEKSIYVGRKELDSMEYVIEEYRNISKLLILENQPCMGFLLTENLLRKHIYEELENREELIQLIVRNYVACLQEDNDIVESTEVFFTESGLRDFMETGLFEVFPYPVYSPFTVRERCEIIRRCAEMIRSRQHVQYLIKDNRMVDLEDLHIEYIKGVSEPLVTIDLNVAADKKERILLFYDEMVHKFEDFFECMKCEKYSYSADETIQILLDTADEYEAREC